jgi:hypothetical protein
MTQEDKNLLLKDLCGRILYGVKCISGVDDKTLIIEGINLNSNGASQIQVTYECSGINFDTKISTIKPYLFPLSSMTEEQKEFIKNKFCYDWDIDDHPYSLWAYCIEIGKVDELIDWFLENHFDYRGLIPMGLANDATNLNIY